MTDDGLIVRQDKAATAGAVGVAGVDMKTGARRRLYRLSLEEYEGMAEQGLLADPRKVVLLDGLLVRKRTEGSKHATAKHRVYKALEAVSPPGWHPRMGSP